MRFIRKRGRGALAGPLKGRTVFNNVLKRHHIAKEIREHRLLLQWEKIVGKRIANRTLPDRLQKGVLWVRVESSSWMHQLSFMKADIIEKANELCGEDVVSDLHFHLGRHNRQGDDALSAAVRIRRAPIAARPLPPPARGRQLQAIENEASSIEDDELRQLIIDVRRRNNL